MKKIILYPDFYAIAKLSPLEKFPELIYKSFFFSVTKMQNELSLTFQQHLLPDLKLNCPLSKNWRLFILEGPFDFGESGVLSNLISPISSENIGVFVVSTFDTDALLVMDSDMNKVINILKKTYHIEHLTP